MIILISQSLYSALFSSLNFYCIVSGYFGLYGIMWTHVFATDTVLSFSNETFRDKVSKADKSSTDCTHHYPNEIKFSRCCKMVIILVFISLVQSSCKTQQYSCIEKKKLKKQEKGIPLPSTNKNL